MTTFVNISDDRHNVTYCHSSIINSFVKRLLANIIRQLFKKYYLNKRLKENYQIFAKRIAGTTKKLESVMKEVLQSRRLHRVPGMNISARLKQTSDWYLSFWGLLAISRLRSHHFIGRTSTIDTPSPPLPGQSCQEPITILWLCTSGSYHLCFCFVAMSYIVTYYMADLFRMLWLVNSRFVSSRTDL